MIEQVSFESEDSIMSDEDFEKEKLVKEEEQATPISDEDFDKGKLGEADLLVREMDLLNYGRDKNFHISCVIQE